MVFVGSERKDTMPTTPEACECCGVTHHPPYHPVVVLERDYTDHVESTITVTLCADCAATTGELYPEHLNRYSTDRATWHVIRIAEAV